MTDKIDDAIAAAQAAYRDLDTFGFNATGGDEPFDRAQVATAIAFLQQCRKTSRGAVSSRYLKNVIGGWGASVGRASYICNGDVIVAAHSLGFDIKRGSTCNYAPANAAIGIKRADIDTIEKRMVQQMMAARK